MSSFILAVVVVGLATHRLARAIAFDSITDPFRHWVWIRAGYAQADAGPPAGVSLKRVTRYGLDMDPKTARAWKWFYGLVSCPHCCGWWIAIGVFLAWQGWSWVNLLGAVAAAGFQSALTSFTSS